MLHHQQVIIEKLTQDKEAVHQNNILLGFDGFIDSIVKAVKLKKGESILEYFELIDEFGKYISSKGNKSCSIELFEQIKKPGGNMPNMAGALKRLGFKTSCIGALGRNQIQQEFSALLKDSCEIFSIADPGLTTAVEFKDGKIMLANMTPIKSVNWEEVKFVVKIEKLVQLFDECTLVCMLNWGEITGCSSIWRGLLKEVIPNVNKDKEKIIFFDLSDFSRRNEEEINDAIELMGEYNKHFKVVLGMNENEALILYNLRGNSQETSIKEVGDFIYKIVNVDVLLIHPRDRALAWSDAGVSEASGYLVDVPKVSTGGGDNFNAGFCYGQLLGMSIEQSMIIGNALSSFYVKNGFSPDIKQLVEYLNMLWI